MQYTCSYSSPLGEMLIASDGSAVTGLWFIGQKYFGSTLEAEYAEKALPVFGQTVRWLDDYFQGNVPMEMPPVSFNSSSFRIRVWKLLMEIPYGHTVTYGEIARMLEKADGQAHMRTGGRGCSRSQPCIHNSPLPQGDWLKRPYGLRRRIGQKAGFAEAGRR